MNKLILIFLLATQTVFARPLVNFWRGTEYKQDDPTFIEQNKNMQGMFAHIQSDKNGNKEIAFTIYNTLTPPCKTDHFSSLKKSTIANKEVSATAHCNEIESVIMLTLTPSNHTGYIVNAFESFNAINVDFDEHHYIIKTEGFTESWIALTTEPNALSVNGD
ncbi:hypothetical protein [Vibrio barjaei]|uniref:hypothetical protein n=1 Tax=Vibrio barjaei TaxID=1676683 RepID=UPI002284CAE1|nr:hypothetical protein [Vibrio barjaei]MCY9872996.1 hypothetical protein [Vibrio barjaei]